MPRNGSGQFSAITNSWNPAINGVPATASDWQAVLNDIVSALTQSVSRDGQTAMTGNLPMAGNKVTGLGNATATGDALTFAQLFSQGEQQDVPAAATTDIGAQLSTLINVTGAATITSFGTNYHGPRFLRFAGVCTLTNSATLVVPGGANLTTAAGDSLIAVPLGNPATGWRVVAFQPQQGTYNATQNGQLAGMRNKIINGKMEIAQRGTSFAAIANGAYSLDRWQWGASTSTGVVTVSQQTDVPSDNEFQNSLRAAVTTSDTSIAAGEFARIAHRIEGFNIRDLIGRTFTLSFRVRSSKTGIHCVAFANSVADRSYVAEYTINAANTWETKTVTVTGGLPTTGTWNYQTGIGLEVNWSLACGPTFQTTAGAWQTGTFIATANQVNCLDTIGNIFAITGVQLEVGTVPTPFEHRPFGAELALCQRYFQRISFDTSGSLGPASTGSGTAQTSVPLAATLRAAGTITTSGSFNFRQGGADNPLTAPTFGAGTLSNFALIDWTMASNIGNGIAGTLFATGVGSISISAEL